MYTVSSYVDENPYLVLEVFDNNLSMIYSNSFEFDASLIFPSGIFIYENEIYVFCGVAPRNYKYGDIINYLFRFGSEFNLLETRELELHDGGYQSICRIDNLLYMAKTMQGLDENGYAIGCFNVDTLKMCQEVLLESEKNHSPVILSFSEGSREFMHPGNIKDLLLNISKDITIPFVLHLDHGRSIESVSPV